MAASKGRLSGIKRGRTGLLFKNIVFGRLETETRLSSGRMIGNKGLNSIKINTNKSRPICRIKGGIELVSIGNQGRMRTDGESGWIKRIGLPTLILRLDLIS